MLTLPMSAFASWCQPIVQSCEGRNFSPLSLLLLVVLSSARGQSCNQTSCVVDGPGVRRDCCFLRAGEVCGEGGRTDCDLELGYRCVDSDGNVTAVEGICAGSFDLNVTEVRRDSIDLRWTDFRPPGYEFEYVLVYRENTFDADLSTWTTIDIGSRPAYTLHGISPGTLYFIRVAVWNDPYEEVLGTTSEAVWVITPSATHCRLNGEEVAIGHVTESCEEVCTCKANGQPACTPRCAGLDIPQPPEGCSVRMEECSCNVTVICPDQLETTGSLHLALATSTWSPASEPPPCQYGDATYNNGANWTDPADCVGCACQSGHVTCQSLCQETVAPPGCANPVRRPSNDCCDAFECPPQGWCEYNDTTHLPGDVFNGDCGLCTCAADGVATCITTCPPLYLPFPSLLCPFPNVRRVGCCDVVRCVEDNVDAQTMLNRLMAISYEPHSLTVSFEVDGATSNAVAQDRYEVLTSRTGADPLSWSSRTVTPTQVDFDENSSSPSTLLHRDGAIRVGGRVYVTVGQLQANTTYYVRVAPLTARDMGVTQEAGLHNRTLVGFLAATTLGEDVVCEVEGKPFLHGQTVTQTCAEVCRCIRGRVECTSACPNENDIMTPSYSCPYPRLVETNSSCCKSWKCFPQDTRSPLGLSAVTKLGLRGPCLPEPAPLNAYIKASVMSLVLQHLPCADVTWVYYSACSVSELLVTCSGSGSIRHKRQLENDMVVTVVVSANISQNYSEDTLRTSLNVTSYAIASAFATSDVNLQVADGFNLTSSGYAVTLGVEFICEEGFAPAHNACVSMGTVAPPSTLHPHPEVGLAVYNLTYDAASFRWAMLDADSLSYITGLVIEYRPDVTQDWNSTEVMVPTMTGHRVTYLTANQKYVARLVAVTHSSLTESPTDRISMSTVEFVTPTHQDNSDVSLILITVTSCTAVLLAATLLTAFHLWRRCRRKSRKETAFENKTFGVSVIRCNMEGSDGVDHTTANDVSLKEDKKSQDIC